MNRNRKLNDQRARRARRVRARAKGTAARPRLTIFRSARAMYAQLIDDAAGRTIAQAHSREVREAKGTKTDRAAGVGARIAERALSAGITRAVADRGAYRFHGRVKALVEAARAGGLRV